MDMNDAAYGSHLWVLKTLLDLLAPRRVVEFGMGFHSTLLFLHYPVHLISIEMENHCWFHNVTNRVLSMPRAVTTFHPIFAQNPLAIPIFTVLPQPDLVFVDGAVNRAEQATAALIRGVETVVMHDFAPESFDYRSLLIPLGYSQYNCLRSVGPPTGVLTKHELGTLTIPEHTVVQIEYA